MKKNLHREKQAFILAALNLQKFTRHLADPSTPFTSSSTRLSEILLILKRSEVTDRATR